MQGPHLCVQMSRSPSGAQLDGGAQADGVPGTWTLRRGHREAGQLHPRRPQLGKLPFDTCDLQDIGLLPSLLEPLYTMCKVRCAFEAPETFHEKHRPVTLARFWALGLMAEGIIKP